MNERSGVRLAEVVAALSLAADLGIGLPMEHALRQAALALGLGRRIGLDDGERGVVYYVGLLAWVGCTADSHEIARWFGDDIAFRSGSYAVDMAGLAAFGYLVRNVGAGRPALRRARIAASLLSGGFHAVEDSMRTHCQLTSDFAGKLGLGQPVRDALHQVFERWDGKGSPRRLAGDAIALPARLVQLTDIVEVFHRTEGIDGALRVAQERSGSQFDPGLVDRFHEHAHDLFAELGTGSTWDAIIAAEPGLHGELGEDALDSALEALAEFVDIKSPYTAGHSTGVARLAGEAARRCGLSDTEIRTVHRAALVHDLGRVGVPNSIWDQEGPLSEAELERVRLHPYLCERMLTKPPAIARLGALAALHHERLDGSGYHRGLRGDAIPFPARILAAADVYHAMLEPRPHRPARTPDEASAELRAEVRAGRLDAAAVDGVLGAAGHRVGRRREAPAGLTAREIEVLTLLARGTPNKEVARRLHISVKTVGNHVEHIYTKIGVSTRAGATLFATRHGLVDPLA